MVCRSRRLVDDFYKEHGYIPALRPGEKETVPNVSIWEKRQPIAVTLGTSYDEWCLSRSLKNWERKTRRIIICVALTITGTYLIRRQVSSIRKKGWQVYLSIRLPLYGGLGARDYYDENNGYIYRWDVQHNIGDLISLIGGNEAFTSALDSMFNTPLGMSKWQFYSTLPDHTGNVVCSLWRMSRACISRTCIIMRVSLG